LTGKDLHYYEPKDGHGLKHDPFNAIIAPRRSAGFLRAISRCLSWRARTEVFSDNP
jgi:hypothetical protein